MTNSGDTFVLSNFTYYRDPNASGTYYLTQYVSNAGNAIDTLPLNAVFNLIVDVDIKNHSAFPTDAFTALESIQIRKWNNLSTFIVNSTVVATLKKLEINATKVNIVSQNFSALTDLMLIDNSLMNTIQQTNLASLKRLLISNCPFSQLSSQNLVTTLHLDGTSISSMPFNHFNLVDFLYLSPRFQSQTFDCSAHDISMIITRKDVLLTHHEDSHVVLIT